VHGLLRTYDCAIRNEIGMVINVRDHKGKGCNVALIKCTWVRENQRGLGFWKGGYKGPDGKQGELVYEQPGTEVDDSCHS
jgi:hypothetical protein